MTEISGPDGSSNRNESLAERYETLEGRLVDAMGAAGVPVLRGALGVVFVWFGVLKVVGMSPAAPLVEETVFFLPPEFFVPFLGVWEALIGLCFLYRPLIRVGIVLLWDEQAQNLAL